MLRRNPNASNANKKTPRYIAASFIQAIVNWSVTYFDTDFLNTRSIFSLMASIADWCD